MRSSFAVSQLTAFDSNCLFPRRLTRLFEANATSPTNTTRGDGVVLLDAALVLAEAGGELLTLTATVSGPCGSTPGSKWITFGSVSSQLWLVVSASGSTS